MPDTDYLTAGLLGIVEGLTEFLPVSSTGHLILADALLGIEGPESKLFDIVIQLGAILAVCWVYRERFVRAAAGLTSDPIAQRFVANIVVAFIAALFVVRTLVDFISRHGFGVFAWYRIIVGAIALIGLAAFR